MKGIDVSKHNGAIDWKSVKADGIEFAIIRAGYGKAISQKDAWFERNYQGCIDNGIPCGAYWYSYAVTPAEAEAEARRQERTDAKRNPLRLPLTLPHRILMSWREF